MQSKISYNTFTQTDAMLVKWNECGIINVGMACPSKMRFLNCIRAYDANFPQRCQVTNCMLLMQCIKWNAEFTTTSTATIFGAIIEELLFNVVTFDVNFLFYVLFFSYEFFAWVFYCWCSRMRLIIKWNRGFSRFARWIDRVEFCAHYYHLMRLRFRGW